ncbi:MAG: outer membrane protein transport protein, partial [Planctomycetota bacterium]
MKRLSFVYTFIFVFFFCGKNVLAQGTAGLHNPVLGASALAQGNAFVARADDASAIYFNPAGLTQLQRPQLSLGASFVLPSVEYHGNGVSEDMDTKINTIPNMYFTSPIIENKLAAGIGINVPYGLQGKWDGDGFSRYVVTDFNLRIIDVNPTITYKPSSFFSVGVGLDYYYANVEQGRHLNVGVIN